MSIPFNSMYLTRKLEEDLSRLMKLRV